MIIDWLTHRNLSPDTNSSLIVEVSGKTGAFSGQLAAIYPNLRFEVQDTSSELLQRGEQTLPPALAKRVHFSQRDLFATRSLDEIKGEGEGASRTIFLLRGVLWNLDDDQAIELLQSFIPAMQGPDGPLLLINDLVSPTYGTFEPHVERAFRRRDVTLMTMHNVKQRTASEWAALISTASPQFKVRAILMASTHLFNPLFWKIFYLSYLG